jgi:hypothetical protein
VCDWYFSPEEFDYRLEDEIVARVYHDASLEKMEKKDLILCWFRHTRGKWDGLRFDGTDASKAVREFLGARKARTVEDWLDRPE